MTLLYGVFIADVCCLGVSAEDVCKACLCDAIVVLCGSSVCMSHNLGLFQFRTSTHLLPSASWSCAKSVVKAEETPVKKT